MPGRSAPGALINACRSMVRAGGLGPMVSGCAAAGPPLTPTMTINGRVIVGLHSVAELSALIDAAAAAKGG